MAEPGTSGANGIAQNEAKSRRPSNLKATSKDERNQLAATSAAAAAAAATEANPKKQRSGLPLKGISETSTETGSASRFISGASERSNQSRKSKIPQCTNLILFAVNYALLVLFSTTIDQYFVGMLSHVQRRFHYPKHELDFITGVEKIGLAVSLLFVGYYGNKLHKPLAMCVGAVLFALGSIACAVPYFIHGERDEITDADGVPTYVLAGLCQSNELTEKLARLNITFGENQCHDYPYSGSQKRSSFSLLCLGQFSMGIGSAFLATLGLVYIDENARKKDTPLLLGIVLSMRGLGDMMGVLLASQFADIDEELGGSVVIWNWDIAAWWLGLPIFAGCLLICAVFLPFFPQWIHEPRWLVQRRLRLQLQAERRQKRIEEAIAKRKRRKRREQQKKREREKKRRERQRREAEQRDEADNEEAVETPPHYDSNESKTKSASASKMTDHEQTRKDVKGNNENKPTGETSKNGVKNKQRKGTEGQAKAATNRTDAEKIQDRSSKNKLEEQKKRKKVSIDESGNTTADDILSDPQSESEKLRAKRRAVAVSKSTSRNGDEEDGITSDVPETEAEAEKRKKEEEEEEKRKRKRRLGRRLQDLPKNLWYLLTKVSFMSAVIGATLSAYLRSGFQAALPHFLHVQFHYSEEDSLTISGLTLGAAHAVGVFAGGYLIYKKHWSVYKQLKLVLVLTGIVAGVSLLLFAVSCDPLKKDTILDSDDPSVSFDGYCGASCDCANLQYSPVCSPDGVLYPTPCHAGCQRALLGSDSKYLNFTDCSCGNGLSVKMCKTECVEMIPYMAISMVMVLTQAMGYVPVIFFFLRIITEKLRSLSLGFALWLVFILGYCPGYAAYYAIDESSCEHSDRDCHDRKTCWLYDTDKYRYMHNGITAALQTAAILCFLVTWYEVRKLVRAGTRLGLPYDNPLDDELAGSRSKSKKSGSSLDAGGSRDNPAFSGWDTDTARNAAKRVGDKPPATSTGLVPVHEEVVDVARFSSAPGETNCDDQTDNPNADPSRAPDVEMDIDRETAAQKEPSGAYTNASYQPGEDHGYAELGPPSEDDVPHSNFGYVNELSLEDTPM